MLVQGRAVQFITAHNQKHFVVDVETVLLFLLFCESVPLKVTEQIKVSKHKSTYLVIGIHVCTASVTVEPSSILKLMRVPINSVSGDAQA